MKKKYSILNGSLAACMFFSVASHACLTSEAEPNDTESNANSALCSGTTVAGSLTRNDADWFSFQVTETGPIDIELDHNRRDDFDWALYQATGPAVAEGATGNVPETGSYNAQATGTYFIKVTRYAGTGWYDLTVNFSEDTSSGPGNDDCGYANRPAKPGALAAYLTGASADSCNTLTAGEGAVLLMGGGSDVDQAFSNRVANHVGSGADVVVIRTSGTDGYNDYLLDLMAADSVETLIIDNRKKANDDYVDWAIRSAEFVWVAGGDQSDYLNQWQGTKVQSAVQHVFDKGGVIGGTSAGMALMADSIYDPDGVAGAVSSEVVTDFCDETLNFSNRFVNVPFLDNSLTDTHFQERDRMGRAIVSLGHHSNQHFSIAASEATSLFINADGNGIVDGSAEVYIFKETSRTVRQTLQCGSAVDYQNVSRVKLLPGDSYNVITHSHNSAQLDVSIDGNSSNFYSPTNPY
ncbi:Type 1 glutamine amidotransferase-like domain-containing protein [Pseudoalteromonas mariniglutinosa]|uniref:Type 1 glutamine amidotransferase-like domain-containing protein n=1 Tax=Pseudoalteromonas mariniglutinosa TaxID=206042 RepID=UPI00384E2E89